MKKIYQVKKEILLREAWQNIGYPILGSIPKRIYWDEKNCSYIVLFSDSGREEDFTECLDKYIRATHLPHRIYVNPSAFAGVEDILEERGLRLQREVNKYSLRGRAKKRPPRFLEEIS